MTGKNFCYDPTIASKIFFCWRSFVLGPVKFFIATGENFRYDPAMASLFLLEPSTIFVGMGENFCCDQRDFLLLGIYGVFFAGIGGGYLLGLARRKSETGKMIRWDQHRSCFDNLFA